MPKVKVLQTNFSSGELSPRASGRVDIARYPNAAKTLRNVISRTLGGAEKRPGTQYILPTKHADKRARLIPYIVSRDKAFMLEMGDNYMRVFKPDGSVVMNGGSPYEIVTPYDEAAALELDYTQGEETMYLFHGDVYPNRLRYFADDYWNCANAPFTTTPFGELGHKPAANLTLSANTIGTGRTMTADASVFLAGDVGRAIIQKAGIAVITAYTSGTVVTVEVKSVFVSTSIATGTWELDASPMVTLVPQDLKDDKEADPIGSEITLTVAATVQNNLAAAKDIEELEQGGIGSTIATAKVTGHGYSTGNKTVIAGCSPTAYNGTFTITVIDADHFTYPLAYAATVVSLGTVAKINSTSTPDVDAFRTEDVGKFVRIDGGLVKITSFVSAKQVVGEILQEMTSPVAAPPLAWTLESSVWGGDSGYPRTGTLHEQRLIAAATERNPQTVWGSRTGEPLDFTLGVNDDEAFSFTIGSDESTQISFVSSGRDLMVLAYNGEYSMQGGIEKPITPTNVQIKPQTPHGCGTVRPVQVGKELLFAQRAGRKVRAYGYKYDEDGYKAPDVTTLAEHITATGVVEMALQQEPDPVVWVVLGNGRLVSVTLDRELDVIAWNSHEIDGAVESVATIPSGDSEQVWMIVRRLVDGNIVRYVERFQPDWYPIYGTTMPGADDFPPEDAPFNWGFMLDCAVTQDDATGKATWGGLGHLEGRTVRVLADGLDMGEFTVMAGEITLPRNAKRVLAGRFFAPTIEMLTPEVQLGTGSSQADAISVNEIGLRVVNTLGATVNGALMIPGRAFGPDLLDQPPELFTGTKFETAIGWDNGEAPPMVISQDSPFPFHLLSVIRSITINGG
jgi:hypothetical protein